MRNSTAILGSKKTEQLLENVLDWPCAVTDMCSLAKSLVAIATPYAIAIYHSDGTVKSWSSFERKQLRKLLYNRFDDELLVLNDNEWRLFEANSLDWGDKITFPVDFTAHLLSVADDGVFYALENNKVYIIQSDRDVTVFSIEDHTSYDNVIAVKTLILLQCRYKLVAYNRSGEYLWRLDNIIIIDATVAENEVGIYFVGENTITFVTNEVFVLDVHLVPCYLDVFQGFPILAVNLLNDIGQIQKIVCHPSGLLHLLFLEKRGCLVKVQSMPKHVTKH